MTYTATMVSRNIAGIQKQNAVRLNVTSYTSGGETVSAGDGGLKKIKFIRTLGSSDNGFDARWDPVSSKLKFVTGAGRGAEVTESWPDVLGGKFANQVASGAAATNGAAIIDLVTATTAAKSTILVQPNALDVEVSGRNVVVSLESQTGGTLPADAGTATIVGTTPAGVAQTEVISLAAVNSVVLGAGGIVFIVGTKAFGTVTSLTLSVDITASIADARVSAGPGTIFGLSGVITAETDIQSVRKDAAAIAAATYVATASPPQIDMGADVADNVDVIVSYSSAAELEAASATDVGELLVEFVGV